jgi:sigma-54 specific flagellar transcriptional regulator A
MLDYREGAMETSALPPTNIDAEEPAGSPATLRPTSRGKIVGASSNLVELLRSVDRVARAQCTVLVTGESGTGKEMLVAAIHDASPRASKPLVTMNCGAIPEALIESELFGHVKGAFTGAHAARQGRVAAAEGGTLFLDEIGEMPLSLQVKLLRLLQQREYSPVGDSRTHKADIRVVAATNRDLEAEVRAGRFREDLFYRLNVVPLHIPALRDRREDIPALALHFFQTLASDLGRSDLSGFADETLSRMLAYHWPGNVRELSNVVERVVLLAAGPLVEPRDLPDSIRSIGSDGDDPTRGGEASLDANLPEIGIDLRAAIEAYESAMVRQALERSGGNKKRAAELLGLNRTTLVEMMKRKRIAV